MSGFFDSNGTTLYYSVDGKGSPVVLLHCLPMDHRIWFQQIFEFSADYSLIAMDFRGLGHSEKTIYECGIETLAKDVSNMMEHLSIERAALVGTSLGGAVALQFAVDFPDKTAAIVVSGSGLTSQTEVVQRKFEGRISGYESAEAKSYYQTHLRSLFSDEFLCSKAAEAIISNYASLASRLNFASIAKLFKALKNFDLSTKIGTVRAPTLIISGTRDRAFADSKSISKYISNSRFVPVDGAGHVVCIEKPLEFNASLSDFLRLNLKS